MQKEDKRLIVCSSIKNNPPEWLKAYENICINHFITNSNNSNINNNNIEIIRPKKISINPLSYIWHVTRLSLNELNDISRISMSMTFKRLLINKTRLTNPPFYQVIMRITFLFNFLHIINTYTKCFFIIKNLKPKFIISDHITYIGGIFPLIAKKLAIPIYTNDYPYGIRISRVLNFKFLNEMVKLKVNEKSSYDAHNSLIDIQKVPYLQPIKNKYIKESLNLKDYNYILYCHSFSDAQNCNGWDGGFTNILDWTIFTLDNLKLNKVIIKPHPNWYAYFKANLKLDSTIYQLLKTKYTSSSNNFLFLDKPINSLELINDLNKNCVAITHHGTMINEVGAMGLKVISSNLHPIYDLKKARVNTWKNKSEYKRLLRSPIENLEKPNINYCRNIYHDFINTPGTFSSEDHWKNKLALNFNKTRKNFEANPEDFDNHLSLLKEEQYDLYEKLISDISSESVTDYSLR